MYHLWIILGILLRANPLSWLVLEWQCVQLKCGTTNHKALVIRQTHFFILYGEYYYNSNWYGKVWTIVLRFGKWCLEGRRKNESTRIQDICLLKRLWDMEPG